MQTIRTALLSFGMSGRVFHAPFIDLHPGFILAGAWERSSKKIEEAYSDVRSYSSLGEILSDKEVELIIVNTPTYTHFDYAKQALLTGKHIVVEKAFTTSVKEAEELKSLSIKQDRKIAVFQNRRWDSDFKTVQKVIAEGQTGKVNEMEIHYDRYNKELSPKKHKEVPGPGAGILMDLGPHLIDQALHLFGLPQYIFADIRICRQVSQVDDYFDLLLYYDSHRVRLKAGYLVREALPSFIVHGEKGSFLKPRADVQEANLLAGLKPNIIDWGTEPDDAKGLLHTENAGHVTREKINSVQGNYYDFYDGLYNALSRGEKMPVTADEGTVIEVSPVIVMTTKDRKLLDKTLLHDYIFEWSTKGRCCMALGLVPIYNHNYKSNCEYFMDFEGETISIKTKRAIKKGEELTVNYNGDWDNEKKVWFEAN